MSSALLAPVMTITFRAPPPSPPAAATSFADGTIARHESRFPLPPPPPPPPSPCLRRKMVNLVLDGSLETADPRKALAGAHMRSSGAASNTSGKGLGHARGIYVRGGLRRRGAGYYVAVIWHMAYGILTAHRCVDGILLCGGFSVI